MNMTEEWDLHASEDPYWAVVTWDKFKGDLEKHPELLAEFFQTGRDHIRTIFSIIDQSVMPGFAPRTALDFGCGVGRLLVPIAEKGAEVSGIDISTGMLAYTRRNLLARDFKPAELVQRVDDLPVGKTYDLVHSYIVLQHIPTRHGLPIVDKLLARVSPGGIAALHVTYSPRKFSRADLQLRATLAVKRVILKSRWLTAWVEKRRGQKLTPPIFMANYPLNQVFAFLDKYGMNNVHVRPSQHGTHTGALIFAQRSATVVHPERF